MFTSIEIEFSNVMDTSTMPELDVAVVGLPATVLLGTTEWKAGGTRLIHTLSSPLDPNSEYYVSLAGGAADTSGNLLDGDGNGFGGTVRGMAFDGDPWPRLFNTLAVQGIDQDFVRSKYRVERAARSHVDNVAMFKLFFQIDREEGVIVQTTASIHKTRQAEHCDMTDKRN